MESFEDFAARLEGRKRLPRPTIRRAPRWQFNGSARRAADRFVVSLGYSPLGAAWRDLGAEGLDAIEGLAIFLEHDLAYGVRLMTADDAREITRQFFSYFTAGETIRLANRVSAAWSPMTNSTFEAAFIAMDAEGIGLFLIEAED